jgi:beta-galactosidase GanA
MRRDLENIRDLGFNTIVLYPPLSRWEGNPPGETAFGTIDTIMDWCAELGLKVILELQGQVMQEADAPECYGYVQNPNYRENGFHNKQKEALLARYFKEVAGHFRGHPALLAYDVFNEIGNNSRSPETIQAFVVFLRRQYQGDIQKLNRAWATYFRDFDNIAAIPPDYRVWTWSSVVAERDWLRFRSHDFAEQIRRWRDALKEIDSATPVFVDVLGSDVLHNRTADYYGVSDWDAAPESDALGLSCYANMLAPDWWERSAWLWPQFWRHGRSAAGEKQVFISELMTHNRSLFPLEKSSMSDELRLWSYQALFHGIQGMIYWKYRPFRRGRQVSGRGLTDFSGRPNHFASQAAEVARFIKKHAQDLAGAKPDDAGCAILHDPEAERLYSAIGISTGEGASPSFYTDAHRGWFRGLWLHGVAPSYITPGQLKAGVPADIKVLIVPCLAGVSAALISTLTDFVRSGGVLVTESRFAILDEDGNLWPHAPGAGLHETFGYEEENFSSRFRDSIAFGSQSLVFHDDYFQELRLRGDSRVLLKTQDGVPAMVESPIGAGRCLHVPFMLGHKMEHSEAEPGALGYFEKLFSHFRGALQPVVETRKKGKLTDVSVLLNNGGGACLAGICNYSEEPDTVVLATKARGTSGVLLDGTRVATDADGLLSVEVPPRAVQAIHFI